MELLYIILSLLPYYESRYTIPLVVANNGSLIDVITLSFINSLVFPLVTSMLDRFDNKLLKVKFIEKTINKVNKKKNIIEKYGYLGLFLFIIIPIPGSGVYSGSILSWLLRLNRKKAYVIILIAVLTLNIIIYYSVLGVLKMF